MTRRDVLRFAAPIVFRPDVLGAAPCQSVLDPRTAADYDAYLKTARAAAEQPLGPRLPDRVPDEQRAEALRILDSGQPYVWNLHKNSPNGALAVYKGVIVDWLGAIRIADASLETFENILQRYDSYKKWYKPYIFDCYARPIEGPGVKNFAVTSILHDIYEKPAPLVPDQHFSFEIMAESNYFRIGSSDARTLLIRTHAVSIREANSGHPEHADSRSKNDLLPPGHGQGVLWRSDTWWRATQTGSGLYAEYESLSLARSLDALEFFSLCSVLRLPGLKDKALESMTVRPRKTVLSVVANTKVACESAARGDGN
jgi:hypothetical protein